MHVAVYLPLVVPLLPTSRPRLLLLAAAVALVAVSGASALEAARDLHALIEFAQAAAGRR